MEIEPGLAEYLQPGERVLWAGRPDPRVGLGGSEVVVIFFGILFAGSAVLWEIGAGLLGGAPWYFLLFGLVFIAVGGYMVIGWPVRVRYVRAHTRYVITDRRAIALTPRAVAGCPLRDQPVIVHRSRSGRATADIGTPMPHDRSMHTMSSDSPIRTMRYVAPLRFMQVVDPDAMVAALNLARSRPPG